MRYKMWDPLVRLFHWSLVVAFAANPLFVPVSSSLHRVVGYAIVALVAARIVWGLVGRGYARFSTFPVDPRAATLQAADVVAGRRKVHLGHTPLGALMIYNLLLAIAVISVSGYAMRTMTFFGVRWVGTVHEVAVIWAEVSVVVHILAVLWESRRTRVNLPLAMVTGYKHVPEESLIER